LNARRDTRRITTFYSASHLTHAPHIEFLHGQNVPYFEMGRRVETIKQHLLDNNLIDLHTVDTPIDVSLIHPAHEPKMLDYLRDVSANVDKHIRESFAIYHMEDQIEDDSYFYESVFPPQPTDGFYIYDSVSPIGKGTWDAVLMSATLAVRGADTLLNGEQMAYALCRPPGHHAGRRFMGGYCYVNNAAVAGYHLKSRGKVAILDIDYHHGNGTQEIVWDDPDILFVSLHADPTQDYPHYAGFASETGGESAPDSNINYPLLHGTSADLYLDTLDNALSRIAEFAPSSLIISLGFDTFKNEPMGHFMLDIPDYETIGRRIDALGLPTLYVQEGGYAIDALGMMGVSFFRGVLEKR